MKLSTVSLVCIDIHLYLDMRLQPIRNHVYASVEKIIRIQNEQFINILISFHVVRSALALFLLLLFVVAASIFHLL